MPQSSEAGPLRVLEPSAPTGAVFPNLPSHQSVTLSIRIVVDQLPLAYLPKLFVCWISQDLPPPTLWRVRRTESLSIGLPAVVPVARKPRKCEKTPLRRFRCVGEWLHSDDSSRKNATLRIFLSLAVLQKRVV
jgi:hypothetical protein